LNHPFFGWLSDEKLIVYDHLGYDYVIRCVDVQTGDPLWRRGIARKYVTHLATCNEGKFILAATAGEGDVGVDGGLMVFDALTGDVLVEFGNKSRDYRKISLAQNGQIVGAVDNDSVCDIFVQNETDGDSRSYARRRVDDLLFGKDRPTSKRHGVFAVAPSGRFGAYGTDEELTIFSIFRGRTGDSAARGDREFVIKGRWRGEIVTTLKVPTFDLFWDVNDDLFACAKNIYHVQKTGSSWSIAARWRFPKKGFHHIKIDAGKLIGWNYRELLVYSLDD
jgi:hypothetical protein